MPFCAGCQKIEETILERAVTVPPPGKKPLEIHANYAEMSECADSLCELCMFFRRECWYAFRLWESDFRDDADATSKGAITIGLGSNFPITWTSPYTSWKLNMGPKYKFGHFVNSKIYDCGTPRALRFHERRQVDLSLQSSLSLCRVWLSSCDEEHRLCRSSALNDPRFLPTRLLDVGVMGQRTIRLVYSKDLEDHADCRYITLSYCWGSTNGAALTTRENLADRLEAIQVDSLPWTIKDAIAVTQGLNVRYLWIDALCIIQGSSNHTDWERELQNMGKIYGHSLMTIAVGSACDSDAGFLRRVNGAYWPVRDCRFLDSQSHEMCYNLTEFAPSIPKWKDVDKGLPLSKRGWVLQERLLASRTLHWTNDGIFWQCAERVYSEYGTELNHLFAGIFPARVHDLVKEVKLYLDLRSQSEHTIARKYLMNMDKWYKIVEDLTIRSFTVATDRIPAITGLGKEVAKACGTEFESGTFKPVPLRELAWIINSAQPARRVPGTPSWSWASVDRQVLFRNEDFRCSTRSTSLIGQKIEISSRLGRMNVKKLDRNHRSVRLVGNLFEFDFREHGCEFEPVRIGPALSSNEIDSQIVMFDSRDDALPAEGGLVKCAQWAHWQYIADRSDGAAVWKQRLGVLLISAVDEKRKIYRRIGWAEVIDDGYFDDDFTDITLI